MVVWSSFGLVLCKAPSQVQTKRMCAMNCTDMMYVTVMHHFMPIIFKYFAGMISGPHVKQINQLVCGL